MWTETPSIRSQSSGTSGDSQNRPTFCQTIVCYHSCGCKSNEDFVYFCTDRNCEHEISDLVVTGLPFACGSQQGRSEECKAEDKAKTEFVREMASATKCENFIVLPECTKEDINALVSPWTGPLTLDGGLYARYRQRRGEKADGSPTPQAPPPSAGVGVKEVDLEEIERKPRENVEAGDKTSHSNASIEVSVEQQDRQEEGGDTNKNDGDEAGLFVVGDDEDNGNEFMDIELDDNYDIYDDVDIDEKLGRGKVDIEQNCPGDIIRDRGSNAAKHTSKIDGTEKEESRDASMPSYLGAVEASRHAPSPVKDNFGELGLSDDVIDYLMAAEEKESKEVEKKTTTLGTLRSYFGWCA